ADRDALSRSRTASGIIPNAPCHSTPGIQPFVGNVNFLLPNEKSARKVRHLRRRRSSVPSQRPSNPMNRAFHIAAPLSSPKRDAGLRACERREALPAAIGKRHYFGTTIID